MLQRILDISTSQLTFVAPLLASLICLLLAPLFLAGLKNFKQSIRKDGPKTHLKKEGTPTMGGLLVIISVLLAFFGSYLTSDVRTLALAFFPLIFALIGFIDDSLKLRSKSHRGIPGIYRLALEFLVSFLVVFYLVENSYLSADLFLYSSQVRIQLPELLYCFFASFVIVGCANAVNLTDGLDGLASLLAISALIALCTIGFFTIDLFYGENIAFLGLTLIGGLLGFLWVNWHPAEVFLGDTGSLYIGSFIGFMSVLLKVEFLLVVFGLLFVVEALSVMIQVFSFKVFGRRVFKMAPIHHHYEQLGYPETIVVGRFWIVSLWLSALSLFIYFGI